MTTSSLHAHSERFAAVAALFVALGLGLLLATITSAQALERVEVLTDRSEDAEGSRVVAIGGEAPEGAVIADLITGTKVPVVMEPSIRAADQAQWLHTAPLAAAAAGLCAVILAVTRVRRSRSSRGGHGGRHTTDLGAPPLVTTLALLSLVVLIVTIGVQVARWL